MQWFNCWVCMERTPTDFRHTHHKTPRASGGTDDPENLVQICENCHTTVHTLAKKSRGPKSGTVKDLARHYLGGSDTGLGRMLELIDLVRIAAIQKKEGKLKNETADLTLKIPVRYHTALKMLTKSIINPKTKRTISIHDLARDLLLGELNKRFKGQLAEPIVSEIPEEIFADSMDEFED